MLKKVSVVGLLFCLSWGCGDSDGGEPSANAAAGGAAAAGAAGAAGEAGVGGEGGAGVAGASAGGNGGNPLTAGGSAGNGSAGAMSGGGADAAGGSAGEGAGGSGGNGGDAAGGAVAAGGEGGASAGGSGGAPAEELVDTFERYLLGRFDSSAQAKTDLSYFEIQVETCRVEAPDLGPRVLYIEQARLDALGQPYRQRLYVLEAGADPATQVVSRVFELVGASKYVGLCSKMPMATFKASQADEKAGCAVRMKWDGEKFVGGTEGNECPSSLNGATYATSEVTLRADGFTSWDRGYDASDKQVWGAVKGGYVFDRKTPLEP